MQYIIAHNTNIINAILAHTDSQLLATVTEKSKDN